MGEIGEYHRDVKAHKKRVREQNPPQRRCQDWMLISGSDVHYARNRSSFKTYRRTPGVKLSSGLRVAGVGTVELQVLKKPGRPDAHILVLEDVLHIPDAICNGFRPHVFGGSMSFRAPAQAYDDDEQPIYYGVDFCGGLKSCAGW